jgi:hypothetical protein
MLWLRVLKIKKSFKNLRKKLFKKKLSHEAFIKKTFNPANSQTILQTKASFYKKTFSVFTFLTAKTKTFFSSFPFSSLCNWQAKEEGKKP